MKYMILIYSNPNFQDRWEGLTESQQEGFRRGHFALADALAESGELVVSEGLADPALAKRVTARDGHATTVDGPFAEVKEHLAGFYLVECDSSGRVVEIAAQVPDAAWGLVEVRPVLDMSSGDL